MESSENLWDYQKLQFCFLPLYTLFFKENMPLPYKCEEVHSHALKTLVTNNFFFFNGHYLKSANLSSDSSAHLTVKSGSVTLIKKKNIDNGRDSVYMYTVNEIYVAAEPDQPTEDLSAVLPAQGRLKQLYIVTQLTRHFTALLL